MELLKKVCGSPAAKFCCHVYAMINKICSGDLLLRLLARSASESFIISVESLVSSWTTLWYLRVLERENVCQRRKDVESMTKLDNLNMNGLPSICLRYHP